MGNKEQISKKNNIFLKVIVYNFYKVFTRFHILTGCGPGRYVKVIFNIWKGPFILAAHDIINSCGLGFWDIPKPF